MNSLVFILLRTSKNHFLELRQKPAKLVMYLLVAFGMGAFVAWSLLSGDVDVEHMDIVWLRGMIFAFLLLSFIPSIIQGLSNGNTLFGMDDVNFLFVSPLNPRSILLYGVGRVMKKTLLYSFFILFYSAMLNNMFGVDLAGMLILLAGYYLTIVVVQIMTVFIYSITNGNPRRKTATRVIAGLMFAPLLLSAVLHVQAVDWNIFEGLPAVLESSVLAFTPVVGWTSAGIVAFIVGDITSGILFFGLLVLFGGALVSAIYFGKPDYYEDVLVSTETMFEKQRAAAEGQASLDTMSDRQIKIKGTGVGGFGASALFYKHVRESFRSNRFGLWGFGTLILVAAAVIYVLLAMHSADDLSGSLIMTPLYILMFLQLFMISMGRGMREMYNHYVYLIPQSPFQKMIWSNIEIMLKSTVEAVLVFGFIGVISREHPLLVIAAIVVYVMFSFLLISINYVYLRFTGVAVKSGILVSFYFLAIIIIMAPGIAGVIIAAMMIESWGLLLGLGILAAWELLMALVCFYAARGLLHNCDMLRAGQ